MKTITEYIQKKKITDNKDYTKYYIANDRSKGAKHEFSSDELEELMNYIEQDEDFIYIYQTAKNPRYHTMEEAILDFEQFLDQEVYIDVDKKEAHAFYILDHEGDGGYSYIVLTTGKIVNTDNLYNEFKSIVKDH